MQLKLVFVPFVLFATNLCASEYGEAWDHDWEIDFGDDTCYLYRSYSADAGSQERAEANRETPMVLLTVQFISVRNDIEWLDRSFQKGDLVLVFSYTDWISPWGISVIIEKVEFNGSELDMLLDPENEKYQYFLASPTISHTVAENLAKDSSVTVDVSVEGGPIHTLTFPTDEKREFKTWFGMLTSCSSDNVT